MIRITFFGSAGVLTGFRVSGHSGYAESGRDIVCAAVSSAAYMTANTVTEILGIDPELTADDGDMLLKVRKKTDADRAADILNGFRLHITELQEQYPDFIHVTNTEV